MKGSGLWKLMYLFCALAGTLAGYGIFTLAGNEEIKPNTGTKDNTLVRESDDSVFFDAVLPDVNISPVLETPTPPAVPEAVTLMPEDVVSGALQEPGEENIEEKQEEIRLEETERERVSGQAIITVSPEKMPSLSSQWAASGMGPIPTPLPPELIYSSLDAASGTSQGETVEVITYPAEIFGQVPVINRSDETVSYFEFCYDLINTLEPIVEQRGVKISTLLTKFVIKALLYGVDIEELNINAPIPRRQAALTLWLAAQLLGEPGCNTSATSAAKYVTDISGCSSSERKAVAYLYERSILKGYQVEGQKFYPDFALKTEAGDAWIVAVKQCWK